jgi:hypothetical protein
MTENSAPVHAEPSPARRSPSPVDDLALALALSE